jgi:hypothetical protein
MSFAGCAAAQEVELRRKYEVGEEQVYRTTLNSSVDGAMLSQTQSLVSVVRQRVKSIGEDSTVVVDMITESLKMSMNGPLGSIEYDSQSGVMPTGPFASVAQQLQRRIGESHELEFSKTGDLVSMEGTAGLDGPEVSLPEGRIRVGAEWDREGTVNLPAELSFAAGMKMRSHYRLREIRREDGRNLAVIDVTMTGTMDPDPSSPAGALMDNTPIESSGEIYFDIDEGILVRSVQRQNMTMSLMGESLKTTSETVTELVPSP